MFGAFQVALVVKNPPANAGDTRDTGSISRWGIPMGRGAWWAVVRGITKD